jgi:hypothetical protein
MLSLALFSSPYTFNQSCDFIHKQLREAPVIQTGSDKELLAG